MQVQTAQLEIVDETPLVAGDSRLSVAFLAECVNKVNVKLSSLDQRMSRMTANAFEILDLRMLSGVVGEMLSVEIAAANVGFLKNPNLDGYPDLVNVEGARRADFDAWRRDGARQFIKYPYGGFEIKNTFGTKKSSVELAPGVTRAGRINAKLDWKAHHRETNNLIGLVSDYLEGTPQIVAAMYSNALTPDDWAKKQNPKPGSTMTSFSVIEKSGEAKMRAGLRLRARSSPYPEFFGGSSR